MNLLPGVASILSDRIASQRKVIEERRKWEEDPARSANLLSHLQRFSVPDKERAKLGSDATLEKVEAAIPAGDPRKGLGLEALNLSRKIMPDAPADTHPQDVIAGVYKELSDQRAEATNLYVQKQESGIFGRRDISKPEGYESWKSEFLTENAPKLEFTNPFLSAGIGGATALAGEGVKRLLAGEVGGAGATILDKVSGKAVPQLQQILASGERVATKAFVGGGRGLTGLGQAVSELPFGKGIAKWALNKGGASVGTKLLGRVLMGAPPVGPVGIGMKVAGAALMAIPDFAMFDLADYFVKKAAPEWSAQRDVLSGVAGLALAAPGMMFLNKGISKMLASKAEVEVAERALVARPTGDNMLTTWKAQKAEGKATDQALIGYRRLLEHKPMPKAGAAAEDFWLGGPSSDAPMRPKVDLTRRALPMPEDLAGKTLGEGFEVSKDLASTHTYDYRSMLKGFTDELVSAGRSPGEALSSAREIIKKGIGLELLNTNSGGLVSGMPMKMRALGPYGVESVVRDVAENGVTVEKGMKSALFIQRHFGSDIFKKQSEGITEIASGETTLTNLSPYNLAQTHGLNYEGVVDYSTYGIGKTHSFRDPKTGMILTGGTKEDIERGVALTRYGKTEAEVTATKRESISKTLEESMAKEQALIPTETSNIKSSVILEDEANKIEDQLAILRKKKKPDTALIQKLEVQQAELESKATTGIEEMFSKQPIEPTAKTEIFPAFSQDLQSKMELYRSNPEKLSDADFMIMHNSENSSWHKPADVQRYKKIVAEKREPYLATERKLLEATPEDVNALGEKIIAEFGDTKASPIFKKAGQIAQDMISTAEKEAKGLGGGAVNVEEMQMRALHEVTKNKFLSLALLGLAAGGTMVSLLSPEEVQAGGMEFAGRTVAKVIADGAKSIKGGIMTFAKELEAGGLLSPKTAADGLKVESYQKPIIVPADFEAITRKKKLPFGLDRILSPYTLGQIYYSGAKEGAETMSNPFVGVASAQTAAQNNTEASIKVFYNIMKEFGIKNSYKAVKETMAPLSKEYQPILSRTAAHFEQASLLKKSIEKAEKSLKKASGDEIEELSSVLKEMTERRKTHIDAIESSKEVISKFQASHAEKIAQLAKTNPSVRVSLLMEEQAGKADLYPWLREYTQPNEYKAAAHLKGMMEDYAGRMAEVGQDAITYKGYVHYAAHPDVKWRDIEKAIAGIESGASSTPRLIKFYERSIGGRNMMPDIFYSMEKYIPDANRRIAFGDFWGMGRKNSWYEHAKSSIVQNNEGLSNVWDVLKRSFDPFENSFINRTSDRIQAFEVARLLAFSPSVSFKHAIKLEATWSNMGWVESIKAMPETASMWARKMTPDRFKKTPTMEDAVVKTFINQGAMARVIADMEVVHIDKNLWDKSMSWANKHGAVMVDAVENFDRAHSMVAAGMMAAKKGMTAAQASYGIMDSILKNNFLSGALNPSWLRDPKVRLLFLFQGTPFKIAEQRAINLWRSGKAVKRAGIETIDLFRNLRKDVKEGENILKYHAIKDALLSEKDIWGTPLVQQTMRKIMVLGSMVGLGSYAFNSEMFGHVVHAPFFEFGDKSISFRLNPLATASYKTWQQKGEDGKSDWMITDFMKNWIKDPFVQNNIIKGMRLSRADIPEMYKDSRVRYLLGVPGLKEE